MSAFLRNFHYICTNAQIYGFFVSYPIIMLRLLSLLAITLHTVVIDPGHGGKDPGAVSKDGKTYEKNLALDIAKKLSARMKAEYPDLKVVMTRDSDVFVPLSDRAAKANKAGADLFISLHVNSTTGTQANGWSVHVMGGSSKSDIVQKNMEICRRENEVVLLEPDYTTSYMGFDPKDDQSYILMSLMQNAYQEQSLQLAHTISQHMRKSKLRQNGGVSQNPFLVLWKTAMPSVLVEMGFISNNEDLAVLRTESGRQSVADAVFEAFVAYKRQYDASMAYDESGPAAGKTATPSSRPRVESSTSSVRYGVQVFTVSKDIKEGDSRLLGYKPVVLAQSGGLKRYIVAVCDSESEARKELPKIRKKYPDAFLVRIESGRARRL